MKRFAIAALIVAATLSTSILAADVGVSVTIGQPGFYGRIVINDYPYPPPRVIYRQPRVIERVYMEREPIYMRVPPGHAKNWRKYCHQYHACGERVYFVHDDWYRHEYSPTYREYHRYEQGPHMKDKNRDHSGGGYGKNKKHN